MSGTRGNDIGRNKSDLKKEKKDYLGIEKGWVRVGEADKRTEGCVYITKYLMHIYENVPVKPIIDSNLYMPIQTQN